MPKPAAEHKDILGQPITEGSHVAVAKHNMMQICKITKVTPKKIRVTPVQGHWRNGYLIYPQDSVLLSGPDAMAYILIHAGTK